MGKYFGTDGIRGRVDGPLVEAGFFRRLGGAVRVWLERKREEAPDRPARILLGRDPRPSGPMLQRAFLEGLGPGYQLLDAGILPTPALARALPLEGASLGVMITASHNPSTDNGIKFFTGEGRKFNVEAEAELEELIESQPAAEVLEGSPLHPCNAVQAYVEAMQLLLPVDALKGWTLVLDTANGATRETSAEVLRNLGANVVHLGADPEGARINAGCGSEHPEILREAVLENRARVGIAHDGDGDRLVCVDERGRVVEGDRLMGLIALNGLKMGWLKEGKVVTTVQSNSGLDRAIEEAGGVVYRVPIGDRWVSEKMLETGASFGGENSGHLIFGNSGSTGDGLLAALMVMDVLMRENLPLSQLCERISLFPQATANLQVAEKPPFERCPHLKLELEGAENRLAGNGRLLLRYSGTEPKLRILVEAATVETAEGILRGLVTAAQKDLEVTD